MLNVDTLFEPVFRNKQLYSSQGEYAGRLQGICDSFTPQITGNSSFFQSTLDHFSINTTRKIGKGNKCNVGLYLFLRWEFLHQINTTV